MVQFPGRPTIVARHLCAIDGDFIRIASLPKGFHSYATHLEHSIRVRKRGDLRNLSPYGHWWWKYPYGNQPEKQMDIQNGSNYFKNDCMHQTGA